MKKVLVTGADGFIGSHLTEQLVRLGYEVKAFVFYNSLGSCGWLDYCDSDTAGKFEVIYGDIRDAHRVNQAITGCDAVFHLAALIGIPYSYHAPQSYVDTNISGTLNVLQAALNQHVKVIHTSTSEVYGTAKFVPITEDHPLQGQSPYSASKIGADQLARSYHDSFNLPVTTVRPFNTYGPRQSARAVIPTVISQLAAGQSSLRLGSLSPTRDFNFVMDTVNGFIAALRSNRSVGETINLGSNYEISIAETVNKIAGIMGKTIEIETADERVRPANSEVERLWACNKKAVSLLDWSPQYASVSGFEEGLKITIDWFSNPENIRFYRSNRYML